MVLGGVTMYCLWINEGSFPVLNWCNDMDICVGHAFLLSDGVNLFSAIETQRFVTFCWEVW